MRKIKRKIKDKYLLIEILSQDSIDSINRIFGTHYSKKQIKKDIRIKKAPKGFDFYKKLMERKPKGAKI
ncbi:unnamed protein product [marine sediment metagenome]|uniref:Uncharacterized protein n=1 Tax=marine sediment metagenome TaxID=412755 RepID=X1KZ56_9ZZZZ